MEGNEGDKGLNTVNRIKAVIEQELEKEKQVTISITKCSRCGQNLSGTTYEDHVKRNECLTYMIYMMSVTMGMILNSLKSIEHTLDEVADSMLGEETE